MPTKRKTLSEQLREFLLRDGRTRYRICRLTGLNQGALSRFVRGKGRLGQDSIDKLAAVLRLKLMREDE